MHKKATLHSAKVSSLPGTVCTYVHAYIVDGKLQQDDVTVMAAGGLFPVDGELDPFTHHVIVQAGNVGDRVVGLLQPTDMVQDLNTASFKGIVSRD
jgi:hypothetical protein